MTFKIIDTRTGKEPTDRVISNIARKGGLMEMDIDGFYVDEDGQIILVDDCGNCTWVDAKRFKVEPETGHWIEHDNGAWWECSECHSERAYGNEYCPDCGSHNGDIARMEGVTAE